MKEIVVKSGTDKIVFAKEDGKKMWVRSRYQNGMLVWESRASDKTVEAELQFLEGWDVRYIERPANPSQRG